MSILNASNQAGSSRGFTLMELMIAVAVVGILAAIALPNYAQYVQRTKRGEAQVALQDAAQFMQRFYAANNRYDVALDGTTAVQLPASMQVVPVNSTGTQTYYTITLDPRPTASAFTLLATPINSMATDTKCGKLTLTQSGARTAEKGTVADCWK